MANFSSNIQPNQRATSLINQALQPNPKMSALLSRSTSKTTNPTVPDWQKTLSNVMAGYKAPTTPQAVTPGGMTRLPTGGGMTNIPPGSSTALLTGAGTPAGKAAGGATKKPTTPTPPTTPPVPPPTPDTTSYSALLGQGQQAYAGLPELGKAAADISRQYAQQYADIGQQAAKGQAGYLTTGTTPIAEGTAAVIAQTAAEQQKAIAEAQQAALTGIGQQISAQKEAGAGLTGLAGLAPTALRYGGTTAGGFDLGSTVQSLARDVANGVKTPSQAEAILGNDLYFNTQLDAAIKAIKPTYSRVTAEAEAAAKQANIEATGGVGAATAKAATSANQALDTLQKKFDDLGMFSKGQVIPGLLSVPILSNAFQSAALATGIGREATSAYQGALNEARSQLASVLTPSIGVDSARIQANALLPDGMTSAEIPQKIQAAKEYIGQRVGALTQPAPILGQQPTTPTSGSISVGGFNFTQDANGNYIPIK